MALNLPARRASAAADVLRILLIEDNPGDARLIREHLADVASTAYDLTHATGLADALATLATGTTTFDAVLLDLSLPDGEGLGNILRLRADAPQVPVVVLTGLDDEDLALQALQVGAQDYLVKGRVLGTEIDKALRYARERRRCEVMVHQQDVAARDAELRERFIGILGHDLRNPLNTIMVSAAVLETTVGDTVDERQRLALQRISTSSRRMARMIDDLLDFTRARLGGGFPIQLAPCDLAALCQQVADEVLGARPDVRIDLTKEGDCAGRWDVDRLAQVISNLTANALDHGVGDQPVAVHVDGRQDMLRVKVVNHGPRIPPDVLPHIFDAFRRAGADTRERSSGLGLGLFIARQIVQAHGGDIAIESDDHATRFTVVLPRHPHLPE